jgi:hypothetical protein
MSGAPRFTLYSRSWCHLCSDMLEALRNYMARQGLPFSVDVVDVDADPVLLQRFDELVPVLTLDPDGPEICHWARRCGSASGRASLPEAATGPFCGPFPHKPGFLT